MITRTVPDLEKEINSLLAEGYRLDLIMPADEPQIAELSRGGEHLRLVLDPASRRLSTPPSSEAAATPSIQEGSFKRPPKRGTSNAPQDWVAGRAGMQYRDLIPGRLGGLLIASHIRITKAGEVPDYVHYHKLLFQMIYCKSGWVRVVYEDQGPPFEMNAGDCVLQPPEIRHRVLESSTGAEVIEVSSPAVHETRVDHDMHLPNDRLNDKRDFCGQEFVRHIAANAEWVKDPTGGYRDTGIAAATDGLAGVRVVKTDARTRLEFSPDQTSFVFILSGEVFIGDESRLGPDDSFVITPYAANANTFTALPGSETLQVTLSPDLAQFFFATSVPTEREP